MTRSCEIVRATPADQAQAFAIVEEYCDAIGVVDRDDLSALRRYLVEPAALWLARRGTACIGCIAVRPLERIEGACEVKRMYVREEHRGRGVAHALMDALEDFARGRGYLWAYLDSKAELLPAIRFYEQRGYEHCERYSDNAEATVFMRRRLSGAD